MEGRALGADLRDTWYEKACTDDCCGAASHRSAIMTNFSILQRPALRLVIFDFITVLWSVGFAVSTAHFSPLPPLYSLSAAPLELVEVPVWRGGRAGERMSSVVHDVENELLPMTKTAFRRHALLQNKENTNITEHTNTDMKHKQQLPRCYLSLSCYHPALSLKQYQYC
jgi:hypothetical protein